MIRCPDNTRLIASNSTPANCEISRDAMPAAIHLFHCISKVLTAARLQRQVTEIELVYGVQVAELLMSNIPESSWGNVALVNLSRGIMVDCGFIFGCVRKLDV